MRFATLALLLLLCCCMAAEALEAGAAKVDITAPIGTPLSGYGARMGRPSTSVHDPIWSRALYLDDGATRIFLVGLDLIGIMPGLRERVAELTVDLAPAENVFLSATHTHSAQGATTREIPIRFVSGRYTPEVLEHTARGIADSMRNAYDKRRRAALGYATGTQEGLSVNRRHRDGPVDPQVGVILVEDADGAPISVVTNFAAHPTSISGDAMFAFSADYPGFYYLEMEELLGPECVPIFLNGALGNQTTGNPEQLSGWDRTESVGRLLARRAHEIADSITFGDVELRTAHTTARLPRTLLDIVLPEQTLLQSLEINDLLISFFPGEACVELALEMRQRALARGYDAHFSVGLSTNHLMYFVPRHLYPDPSYESTSSFFGPGIADWFYEHFEDMMHKPVPEAPETDEDSEASEQQATVFRMEEIADGVIVDLAGSPREMGLARGDAFVASIQHRFDVRVATPLDTGAWIPTTGMLAYMPRFMDTKALGLPLLGMGSRALLQGISMDLIQEMEGMAEGARMAFDALWLLQHAPMYERIEDKALLFSAPLCTMFAVVGNRADDAGLLVGRNLDWPFPEEAVISRVRPDTGHAFMQAGFTWNAGVFTAMNENGVTLAVERVQQEIEAVPQQAPIEFILRDLIQEADDFDSALARLQACDHISGVHVLVAGYSDGRPRAAVVEYRDGITVREPDNGLLLGVLPDNPTTDAAARSRYLMLEERLAELETIGKQDARDALTYLDDVVSPDMDDIWNAHTRHSVVFLPESRLMHVALPTPAGTPGPFVATPLSGDIYYE